MNTLIPQILTSLRRILFYDGKVLEWIIRILITLNIILPGFPYADHASERLGYPLPDELIVKVRQHKWSYMGLEMMIDTVKTIEPGENLLDLIATSIIPLFLLFGSSLGPRGPRSYRGGIEDLKRRNLVGSVIRPK